MTFAACKYGMLYIQGNSLSIRLTVVQMILDVVFSVTILSIKYSFQMARKYNDIHH